MTGTRRELLRLLASVPVAMAPMGSRGICQVLGPRAGGATFDGRPTMIVAGPEGGGVDAIAARLAPLLARSLLPGTSIRRRGAGGLDGVTAANQFTVRAAPDGETVLLVPGAAALAWLTGDSRAHFDTASWVPVMAGLSSGVIAGRLPAGGIGPGGRLRIAAELTGTDLPGLLAVHLLGASVVPVHGLHDDTALRNALLRGDIDLVLLRERNIPARLAALARTGATPLFSLGTTTETGALTRDPLLPDLPDFAEFYLQQHQRAAEGPLFDAWRAAAVASQLDFALVLPQLTPGAMVAIWRQAAAAAADTSGWYPSGTFRVLAPAAATACIAATVADAAAQLELRRWMAVRFDWQPV